MPCLAYLHCKDGEVRELLGASSFCEQAPEVTVYLRRLPICFQCRHMHFPPAFVAQNRCLMKQVASYRCWGSKRKCGSHYCTLLCSLKFFPLRSRTSVCSTRILSWVQISVGPLLDAGTGGCPTCLRESHLRGHPAREVHRCLDQSAWHREKPCMYMSLLAPTIALHVRVILVS